MYWNLAALLLSPTTGKAQHLSMILARITTRKKMRDCIIATERACCHNNYLQNPNYINQGITLKPARNHTDFKSTVMPIW